MKQVNIASTNIILFLVLTHMWNKYDLKQGPSLGNFCWPLWLQGSHVKMSIWWCWVSWFHWAVSLLILPFSFFFPQENIRNLGLCRIDFGLLGNIRHLIWICFRASKTQEPKGPALSPGYLSSSWRSLQLPIVSLLLHKLTVHEVMWWTKQWNNSHLWFPLARLFSILMNSPMQCSVQPY